MDEEEEAEEEDDDDDDDDAKRRWSEHPMTRQHPARPNNAGEDDADDDNCRRARAAALAAVAAVKTPRRIGAIAMWVLQVFIFFLPNRITFQRATPWSDENRVHVLLWCQLVVQMKVVCFSSRKTDGAREAQARIAARTARARLVRKSARV